MEVLVLILDLLIHILTDRLLDALCCEVRQIQSLDIVVIGFKWLLRLLLDA